jgi:hypothetical protein
MQKHYGRIICPPSPPYFCIFPKAEFVQKTSSWLHFPRIKSFRKAHDGDFLCFISQEFDGTLRISILGLMHFPRFSKKCNLAFSRNSEIS